MSHKDQWTNFAGTSQSHQLEKSEVNGQHIHDENSVLNLKFLKDTLPHNINIT